MKVGVATDHSHSERGSGREEEAGETCKSNVLPCGRFLGRAVKTRQAGREEGGSGKCVRHAAWHTECKKAMSGMDLLGSAPQKTKERSG